MTKNLTTLENQDLVDGVKSGKIAVIPTDTIYGIVACAVNEKSVNNIYKIKKRAPEKPFIILISDISDLKIFNVNLPINLLSQLSEYWPGSNSLILKCDDEKFDYLTRGTHSLAIRLPMVDELRDFVRKTGPLVAPSANPEGLPPAADIDEAVKYFGDQINFYVDAGNLTNLPSSLFDFISGMPIKLR